MPTKHAKILKRHRDLAELFPGRCKTGPNDKDAACESAAQVLADLEGSGKGKAGVAVKPKRNYGRAP